MTMLSITTDFAGSRDCPLGRLQQISAAGFSHVHWCHQWNTDYLYGDDEIAQIAGWLGELNLSVTDIHASAGAKNDWLSPRENKRQAGVELVKNRVVMAERLETDVIILHMPQTPKTAQKRQKFHQLLDASLDDLTRFAGDHGVRIALENLKPDNFDTIEKVLAGRPPQAVGLCYDSGHGLLIGDGLDRLARMTDRLISVHLHDNNSRRDQHNLPFTGKVDWRRLTDLIARSPYRKPISLEVTIGRFDRAAETFLAGAFEAATKLSNMVDQRRLETKP